MNSGNSNKASNYHRSIQDSLAHYLSIVKNESNDYQLYLQLADGIGVMDRANCKPIGILPFRNLVRTSFVVGKKIMILVGLDKATKRTVVRFFNLKEGKLPSLLQEKTFSHPYSDFRLYKGRTMIRVGDVLLVYPIL